MKYIFSTLTTGVLIMSETLSCNWVLAADENKVTTKPSGTTLQQKKTTSFMFVIDAKKGEIKKDKKGQYHLVLKKVDMKQVIMFSDRPQRIVKYITGKDLKKIWKEGTNSFQEDPPNAVLSANCTREL